jgi:hypothetical protein
LGLGLGHIIVGSTVLLWIFGAFSGSAGSGRGEVYYSGEAEFVGFIGGIITLFLMIIIPIIILVGIGLLLQSETAYAMVEVGATIFLIIGGFLLFDQLLRANLFRSWFLVFPQLIYGSLTIIYFEKFVMTKSRRENLLNKALTSLKRGDTESAKELLYKVRSFK